MATDRLRPGDVLFPAPPLVISRDEIDQIVDILDEVSRRYEEQNLPC